MRCQFGAVRRLSSHTRVSAKNMSLDVNLISSNFELVESHMMSRNVNHSIISDLRKIHDIKQSRAALVMEVNNANHHRKTISQDIGKLMKSGTVPEDHINELKLAVEEYSNVSKKSDNKLLKIDQDLYNLMSNIPNLIDDSVPNGSNESDNVQVKEWGTENRKIALEGDETYRWHDDIATDLGGIEPEAAVRLSGARFNVFTGHLARLERALINFFIDFHCDRGYTEVSVPYIVSRSTMVGTGQLPKFEEDLFKVAHSMAGEDAFLIPTAEVPVTSLYRDQLLELDQLPLHYVCGSPAFRSEAGSGGRDTRGLLRQHQFFKVELVKIVQEDCSEVEHQSMVADSEAVLEALGLPYRTVLLCSGDMGFAARKCYDIEVWLPGQQQYREIASISNCHDFQSRRMSMRYRTQKLGQQKVKGAKTTSYPHTLNGSGVAVGRAMVAILENFQRPDGGVDIPKVLVPYMNGMTVLMPKTHLQSQCESEEGEQSVERMIK